MYYLHTKGVSYTSYNLYVRYWRQLMLDEVVTNHERCLGELAAADTCGTFWRGSHYAGNYLVGSVVGTSAACPISAACNSLRPQWSAPAGCGINVGCVNAG